MSKVTVPYTAGGFTINVCETWSYDSVNGLDVIEAADWNRIETNIDTLRSYMISISYAIPTITTTTNRDRTIIMYLADINRIEQNLETIRNSSFTPPDYGGSASWTVDKGCDFNEVNRIEGNIKDLFLAAEDVFQSFIYCGMVQTGYERDELDGLY